MVTLNELRNVSDSNTLNRKVEHIISAEIVYMFYQAYNWYINTVVTLNYLTPKVILTF